MTKVATARRKPAISFVMPCYNEEDIIEYTIPKLVEAFDVAGIDLELVAVDNGSRDRTGEIIGDLARRYPAIVPHRVDLNEGYGKGVLAGLTRCRAPWFGIIPADGQVDAEDVVRLFEAVRVSNRPVLAKVRRRFRLDGLLRKVISTGYNAFVRLLWPRLQSIDINGSPKILPREVVERMHLESKGWLLDPEIMIKAHYMGLDVLEFNVFGRMRSAGVSHVRPATCWEFLRALLRFRFSLRWRRRIAAPARTPSGAMVA